MPNNNPDGYNAFGGPMEREQPYGAGAKLQALTRLAPTAQPIAVGEPRRSQKRATRKQRKQAVAPPVPPTQPTIPYEQVIASFWAELAAEPGASPLIQEIARGLV